ncbi:hypothetical protein D3C73_1402710 [compost metagenome]
MASATSASVTVAAPARRRLIGQVSSPGMGAIRASQIDGDPCGWAVRASASSERRVSSKASGSTTMTRVAGLCSAMTRLIPAISPPPEAPHNS